MLRAADQLITDRALDDAVWLRLRETYDERQLIELCLLAGHYEMLAGTLNSLGVQIEPGYPVPRWAGTQQLPPPADGPPGPAHRDQGRPHR